MKLLVILICLAALGLGQSYLIPPADSPWWLSDTGKSFRLSLELSTCLFTPSLNTVPTTLHGGSSDGVPACGLPQLSALECLNKYKPEETGDFCVAYGYATVQQAVRFQYARGYIRRSPPDPTGGAPTWLLGALYQKTCTSTTMDGLPNCPMPKWSSYECLIKFPPEGSGGYCEWYGYATVAETDEFERKRGFVRVKHADRTSDTWRRE